MWRPWDAHILIEVFRKRVFAVLYCGWLTLSKQPAGKMAGALVNSTRQRAAALLPTRFCSTLPHASTHLSVPVIDVSSYTTPGYKPALAKEPTEEQREVRKICSALLCMDSVHLIRGMTGGLEPAQGCYRGAWLLQHHRLHHPAVSVGDPDGGKSHAWWP